MNLFYRMKAQAKFARYQMRRARTALKFGNQTLRSSPVVLGNAIPKAGSHLTIQLLRGLTKIGPFIDTGFPPVNRAEDNSKLGFDEIVRRVEDMRPGDLGYGYLHYKEPYISLLTKPGRALIFIYRDPRDVIFSAVRYATEGYLLHGMHDYYANQLKTDEERIDAEIFGVQEPGFEYSGVMTRYEKYIGWLDEPRALCVRFEDLMLDREAAVGRMIDFLGERGFDLKVGRDESVRAMMANVNPGKSGTFRKGQPGNWKEHFTQKNIEHFKEITGDLVVRLGYEKDMEW